MSESCEVKGCRNECNYTYLGKDICEDHWDKHCDEQKSFNLKTASFKNGKIDFFEVDYRKAKLQTVEEAKEEKEQLPEEDNATYTCAELDELRIEVLRDGIKVGELKINAETFSLTLSAKKDMNRRWSSTNQTIIHKWADDCVPDDVEECIMIKIKEYLKGK